MSAPPAAVSFPPQSCPVCGLVNRLPRLQPGECARCHRCETTLAVGPRSGRHSASAFTLTGLLLAGPAVALPFVTVSKFQSAHESYLFSGAHALWDSGMNVLAVWVGLCGLAVPLLLLGTLAALLVVSEPGVDRPAANFLLRIARAFEQWAMPEVQMLAVLVAFAKLGSLVHVQPGPGLWCYAAMALCTLVAWRNFELCHAPQIPAAESAGLLEHE